MLVLNIYSYVNEILDKIFDSTQSSSAEDFAKSRLVTRGVLNDPMDAVALTVQQQIDQLIKRKQLATLG